MKLFFTTTKFIIYSLLLSFFSSSAQVFPSSDPENKGKWILNSSVSDEFNSNELNPKKWRVVGEFKGGVPTYENEDRPGKTEWIGRAPSQFSGKNFRLENNMLKLETKWEPDFPFSDRIDKTWKKKELKHENITTACIIGRNFFKYGYLEIRCKAADAEVTSSFWAMGKGVEFDLFEMFGDHRDPKKEERGLDRELWWSIHDWTRTKPNTTYTEHKDFGFRVADDFHVYGIDWSKKGIKYYVDGKLFFEVSRSDIEKNGKFKKGTNYVIDKPLSIWLDQETFPWHGIPDSKEDLHPSGQVDFEIDYVRVWQKKLSPPNSPFFGTFRKRINPCKYEGFVVY